MNPSNHPADNTVRPKYAQRPNKPNILDERTGKSAIKGKKPVLH